MLVLLILVTIGGAGGAGATTINATPTATPTAYAGGRRCWCIHQQVEKQAVQVVVVAGGATTGTGNGFVEPQELSIQEESIQVVVAQVLEVRHQVDAGGSGVVIIRYKFQ